MRIDLNLYSKLLIRYLAALLFWVCFFGNLFTLKAQEKQFKAWTTSDGLPQNNVNAVIQDQLGFIWLATDDGLARFDGLRFKVYRKQNQDVKSLPNNQVRDIAIDKSGALWIATKNGVSRFDRRKERFDTYRYNPDEPNSVSSNEITTLFVDSKGRVWVGTKDQGLSLYNPEQDNFVNFKTKREDANSLSGNYVRAICEDSEGNIWVAVNDYGIDKLSPQEGVFEHFTPDPYGKTNAPSNDRVGSLLADPDKIWIGTDKGGLNVWDMKTQKFSTIKTPAPLAAKLLQENITSLFKKENILWIGTEEGGLYTYDEILDKLSYPTSQEDLQTGLSSRRIQDIYQDKQDGFWIATSGGGINYSNPYKIKFKHYKEQPDRENGLADDRIQTIYKRPNGDVWLGTSSAGISVLKKENTIDEEFINIRHRPEDPQSIRSDKVWTIYPDLNSEDHLWVGTNEGLNRLHIPTLTFEYHRLNLGGGKDYSIKTLYQDEQRLWIGTYSQGLIALDVKTKEAEYFKSNEYNVATLSHNHVHCLYEDRWGTLWVGTEEGLNLYDGKSERFIRYTQEENNPASLSNNRILSMTEDKDGNLWIGTAAGLNLFDHTNANFTVFNEQNGLPNSVIQSILPDKEKSRIWVSTNKGAFVFDTKKKKVLRTFDVKDGLQGNEFLAGAAHVSEDGEIFWGGLNGFNRFYPDQVPYNSHEPPIVLTDFRLFRESMPVQGALAPNSLLPQAITDISSLTLPYDANVFAFEFAALDYMTPNKNIYAYRLTPFENNWNFVDALRSEAIYTNLAPGKYTFEVKGANADGVWNDAGHQLEIIITPPVWKTWWFQVAAVLLFLVLSFAFYRYRVSSIEKQRDQLNKLVHQRTEELAQQTLALEAQTKKLEKQNYEIQEQNNELGLQAQEIRTQRDRIEQQNKRLQDANSNVQRAYENIKILSDAGRQITAKLDLREMIFTVYQNIKQVMPAYGFGIALYEEENTALNFPLFLRNGTEIHTTKDALKEKKLLSVICFEQQRELFINNIPKDYFQYTGKIYPSDEQEHQLPQACIFLPLILNNKSVGILTVQAEQVDVYTQEHLTFLRSLASYVAIALDNADAYRTIEDKNRKITDSIRYALTIQKAMLPTKDILDSLFEAHFVLFRPQAIVSGDFYWISEIGHHRFVAVIDCTGHGVPGGFMSTVGKTLLNEIVNQQRITDPSYILETLHLAIRSVLKQDDTTNDDGMDVCLCAIERPRQGEPHINVTFAGAKRPLYYVLPQSREVIEIKGTKRSIGGRRRSRKEFQNEEIQLPIGTKIYLTTDGYADQFSPEREKYGSLRFKGLIGLHSDLPFEEQRRKLDSEISKYQGDTPQNDDITIMGIRL
ncbi:MAG: SpoIIE family protein phosphatase [Bernardetiaceae bacterium]|nr:SpoIIE family protein phosphatase [Bernardetiaceae bacterium]